VAGYHAELHRLVLESPSVLRAPSVESEKYLHGTTIVPAVSSLPGRAAPVAARRSQQQPA
jgi:hypothetical protein